MAYVGELAGGLYFFELSCNHSHLTTKIYHHLYYSFLYGIFGGLKAVPHRRGEWEDWYVQSYGMFEW